MDFARRDDFRQRRVDKPLAFDGVQPFEGISDGEDLVATAAAVHFDATVIESGLDEALVLVGILDARGFRFLRGAAVYTSVAERSRQEALRDMGEGPAVRPPGSVATRSVEGPLIDYGVDITTGIT